MKHISERIFLLTICGIFSLSALAGPYALHIDSDSEVGIGTANPSARLHVLGDGDDAAAQVFVENTNTATPDSARKLFVIKNDGPAKFSMLSGATDEWAFNARDGEFRISKQGSGTIEMELSVGGNMEIGGTITQGSSRAIKQDIEAVSADSVLEKVVSLPIAEWSYKHDGNAVRHVGPMSEDFYQAFGLGSTDKGLTSIDTSGVALAAIQGLNDKLVENRSQLVAKDAEIAALRATVANQEERMLQMEMVLAELMNNKSSEVRVSVAN